MKKFMALISLLLFLASMFGCGSAATITTKSTTTIPATPIKQTTTVSATTKAAFLDSADTRSKFDKALANRDYDLAISLVKPFESRPLEKEVLNQLDKAQAAARLCKVSYDKFTEKTTMYPKDISGKNIVALFKGNDTIDINFNTISKDWIFWDTVKIKVGSEYLTYPFRYSDVTRDVFSSNSCYESAQISFDDRIPQLEKIINAGDPMIRFEGEKVFDASISKVSQDSLNDILTLYKVHQQVKALIN